MSSTQSPILVSKLSCEFPLRHLISWMFNTNAHVVQIAGILRYSLASHRSSQCFNDEISSSVIHETSMALNNIIGSMLWVFSRIAYLNVEDPAALDQALAAQAHLWLVRSTSRFFLNFETLKLSRERMPIVEVSRATGLRFDVKPRARISIRSTEHPVPFLPPKFKSWLRAHQYHLDTRGPCIYQFHQRSSKPRLNA